MKTPLNLYKKLDWPLIVTYLALVLIGWISVFASVYDEEHAHILDMSQRYGMQFIWKYWSGVNPILSIPPAKSSKSWADSSGMMRKTILSI